MGDSADSPRFIETLARNGYRFIAPVTQSLDEGAAPVTQRKSDVPEAAAQSKAAAKRRSFRALPLVLATILLITAIGPQ